MVTAAVLLAALSGCTRRSGESSDSAADYAMTVHLVAPAQEQGPGGSCEIASRTAPDGAFTLDSTFLLHNGPGRQQTTLPAGVLDDQQRCRVTLSFLFVQPDADFYILRTEYGNGWRMTNAEAFSDPVIDLVERPPGDV